MSRRRRRNGSGLRAIIAVIVLVAIIGGVVYDLFFFVPNRNRMEWDYENLAGYETDESDLVGKLLYVWKFDDSNKPTVDNFLVAQATKDAEWGIIGFYASEDEAKKQYEQDKDSADDKYVFIRRGRALFYGTEKASYMFRFMLF